MIDDIKKQIDRLSISEQIILVEEIWDNINNKSQHFEPTKVQKEIIKKRDMDFSTNPNQGRNWEKIKDEALNKNE